MIDTNERHAVTQADRIRAETYFNATGEVALALNAKLGAMDHCPSVQAFAAHRIAAEAAQRERDAQIAEHLNGWGSNPCPALADHIAQAIREQKT